MKEKTGMRVLQLWRRPGAFLGFLCIAALVLIGCGAGQETSQPVTTGPSVLPHSLNGYELYSWREGREWHFTLITGTNRLKSHVEIVSVENVVTETDWVKLSVQGTGNLKTMLNRLPEGEAVTWNSGRWLESVGLSEGKIQLPGPELLREIESHCHHLGIRLQVAN